VSACTGRGRNVRVEASATANGVSKVLPAAGGAVHDEAHTRQEVRCGVRGSPHLRQRTGAPARVYGCRAQLERTFMRVNASRGIEGSKPHSG